MWKFLISEKKITRVEFNSSLQHSRFFIQKDGYYCLKKRVGIISQRKKNLSEVEIKLERARTISKKLSQIPSILFIGVSGGLAAGSASKKDDIDLVVITKKNTLYTTRFLLLIILQVLGVRRSRNQKETADTICLNLLFDETVLSWFSDKQDIYTAREISQLLPLFERNDTYRRFLVSNNWIKKFMPNVTQLTSSQRKQGSSKDFYVDSCTHSGIEDMHRNDSKITKVFSKIIINPFFETIFRFSQMSLMKRHQTREILTKHVLAFHPNDYRIFILDRLRLKMRQLGLLTKF